MDEFSGFQNAWATLAPWTISGIARQSILSSNRAGGQHIDRPAFRRIANLFDQVDVRPNGQFETYPFLAGKAHEQFSYQLSGKEDLSRTLSVLLDTPVNFKGQKSKADLDALLGAPLDDLATSTFVLYGIARAAKGVITRNAIEQLVQEAPNKLPSIASIWATLERLSATIDEARSDAVNVQQFKGGLQKYGYNPLTKTPFIRITDDFFVAPQTFFILRSCSLENIYYLGMKQWPKEFGADLGHRLEAYAGRQLQHSGDLEVHPEISWKGKKSIDWFVITPAATILIECKSAHVALDARVGAASGAQSVGNKLLPAHIQIDKTDAELRAGNDAFNHIPRDRPVVGLIVTAEPIYNANFEEVRDLLPDSGIPILALCLRDLESMATLPADILGETLLKIATDPELSRWDVFSSMKHVLGNYRDDKPNALIDNAYLKYVMPERLVPLGGSLPD